MHGMLLQKCGPLAGEILYILTAHDGLGLPHQIPGRKYTVRPGIADADLLGIAPLKRGADPGAPAHENLQDRVGKEYNKLCVPGAEDEGFSKYIPQRLCDMLEHLPSVGKYCFFSN